jgi:hypothetical protein
MRIIIDIKTEASPKSSSLDAMLAGLLPMLASFVLRSSAGAGVPCDCPEEPCAPPPPDAQPANAAHAAPFVPCDWPGCKLAQHDGAQPHVGPDLGYRAGAPGPV